MEKEIWKSIEGFEGIFEISTYGNIKSYKTNDEGYLLSNINKNGDYLSVVLKDIYNKKIKYTRIHRLVAKAFIPNPDNKPEVNHIDGNKQNNNVNNLEWVTRSENMQHAIKNNPNILNGIRKYNQEIKPKPILQYSLKGEFINEFINASVAEKATGVCKRNILHVANKEEYKPGKIRKQAGGFIWKIKE